ncbi:MAG: DUF4384 domain-containing protein [Bacteroidetes bacterium]|nr:DUF4384 domain-containing protein [Bacteroidota bacterium]
MPIRMEKDENRGGKDNYPGRKDPSPRPKTGGGFSSLIPLIISIVARKPKLLILLIVVAAAIWIFGGIGGGIAPSNQESADFGMGMEMKQEVYDQAEVYEPLADNKKNPLPEKTSLEAYAPARLNQGQQGSCVGWASSYAARTILHARATGINPNRIPFSPSYVYNQIALEGCQGSYMVKAMETLNQDGDLPLSQFGYDERSCRVLPDRSMRADASEYRIRGYNRLSQNHDQYEVNMLAIKQNLAQGAPVVIGMQVGGSFMQSMKGRDTWIPTKSDYSLRGFGGHAMCVIGYDDYHNGSGAFQIMNSWGPEWGNDGIGWVRYKDFEYFVKEAYGLYPMGDANKVTTTALEIEFGLVDVSNSNNIRLKQTGNNEFTTTQPISAGDKFKVEITNSIECYVYVFGQETDGTSYVLFPYTPKHSPYCGITGTRIFPRDYSMVADNLGSKDYIAAVFTKVPVDFDNFNQAITQSAGNTYTEKLNNALSDAGITNLNFDTDGSIGFKVSRMEESQAVGIVIGIEKR